MTWKRLAVVVGVAAGLAACGGSDKGNVSVSAKGASAGATSGGATQSSLDLGNGVSIDTVKVVVRKVELEGPGVSCAPSTPSTPSTPSMKDGGDDGSGRGGADDPPGHDQGDDHGGDRGGDDDDCEFEAGPFLVSLSGSDLQAGIHPQFDASLPTGTFHEISVRIDTINAEKAARAPIESQRAELADMAARNVSLEITGSRDGQPFDLAVAIDVKLKVEGSFTITPDTVANLTFPIDASGWFGTGATLDPSAQAAQIIQNILSSLRIVHDDDHDGQDDHGGHGNDDGPGHT